MSDLVGNPEDRFSRVTAHMTVHYQIYYTFNAFAFVQCHKNLQDCKVQTEIYIYTSFQIGKSATRSLIRVTHPCNVYPITPLLYSKTGMHRYVSTLLILY